MGDRRRVSDPGPIPEASSLAELFVIILYAMAAPLT
jgi:hypothetical protein